MSIQKSYPYILIVGSVVGLIASFMLTLDTISLIADPAAQIPCNLNPFVSCSNAALAWQGNVFGFPNSLLGIIAFSMLLAVGVGLVLGAKARKNFWLLMNVGLLAAVVFVHWFIFESLYRLGTLCIYCMTVWIVTWPLFIYTTVWNMREEHFEFKGASEKFLKFIGKNHLSFLMGWYLLIIFLILLRFREFFIM